MALLRQPNWLNVSQVARTVGQAGNLSHEWRKLRHYAVLSVTNARPMAPFSAPPRARVGASGFSVFPWLAESLGARPGCNFKRSYQELIGVSPGNDFVGTHEVVGRVRQKR